MSQLQDFDATVVITTRNRCEELPIAIDSALSQRGSIEVLVVDDASTDKTAEIVRSRYPMVRLERTEQCLGLIRQRNRAARLARGRVLVSMDDDAVFTTPHVIEQTLPLFNHPRVGAVAIPICNVKCGDEEFQRAPDITNIWCQQQYIGTAHALRRDMFLGLGGYRAHYFRQGEERDLSVRMLANGYIIRVGTGDRIDHFESPRRSFKPQDYYGRRNDILFPWHNAPITHMPWTVAKMTIAGLRHTFRTGRYRDMLAGLCAGYAGFVRYHGYREPVGTRTWQLYQKLKKMMRLDNIEQELPPVVPVNQLQACRQAITEIA